MNRGSEDPPYRSNTSESWGSHAVRRFEDVSTDGSNSVSWASTCGVTEHDTDAEHTMRRRAAALRNARRTSGARWTACDVGWGTVHERTVVSRRSLVTVTVIVVARSPSAESRCARSAAAWS